MMKMLLLSSVVSVFLVIKGLAYSRLVKITKLDVPQIVDPRKERVLLRCDYDLSDLELYSVNWYKNQDVIYRYMPNLKPKSQVFQNHVNVKISLEGSNSKQLLLLGSKDYRKNKEMYEGTYVCEVSAEAPFPTDFAVANMSVAILPSRDPIIEGVLPSYGIGDFLEANCTSPPSFPVSELTFFLNGRKVDKSLTKPFPQSSDDKQVALEETTCLGLVMRLERVNFRAGNLILSCISRISGIPTTQIRKTEKHSMLINVNNQIFSQEPMGIRNGQNTGCVKSIKLQMTLILELFLFNSFLQRSR